MGKTYFIKLKCINCKESSGYLEIEQGNTIEEWVEKNNILCNNCNCPPIKVKEKKE